MKWDAYFFLLLGIIIFAVDVMDAVTGKLHDWQFLNFAVPCLFLLMSIFMYCDEKKKKLSPKSKYDELRTRLKKYISDTQSSSYGNELIDEGMNDTVKEISQIMDEVEKI